MHHGKYAVAYHASACSFTGQTHEKLCTSRQSNWSMISTLFPNAWKYMSLTVGGLRKSACFCPFGDCNVLPIIWFGEAADFPSALKVSCSNSTPYPTKEHESIVLSLHKLMEEGSRTWLQIIEVSLHRKIMALATKDRRGQPNLPALRNCSVILHPSKLGKTGNARRANGQYRRSTFFHIKIGRSIPVAAPHSWALMHQCDPESPPKHPSWPCWNNGHG